jgi:NAD(P)-dependent dehydrogenase (short-subunit alcohol dehydrogenase family)
MSAVGIDIAIGPHHECATVNVSTMVAISALDGTALYGLSKAAVELLAKAWAAEFGPQGIRVNAVGPGPTRTEGPAGMSSALDELAAVAPAGRPAGPEEITSAIVYLTSDEAGFIQIEPQVFHQKGN